MEREHLESKRKSVTFVKPLKLNFTLEKKKKNLNWKIFACLFLWIEISKYIFLMIIDYYDLFLRLNMHNVFIMIMSTPNGNLFWRFVGETWWNLVYSIEWIFQNITHQKFVTRALEHTKALKGKLWNFYSKKGWRKLIEKQTVENLFVL
jgi:hypothetical protein